MADRACEVIELPVADAVAGRRGAAEPGGRGSGGETRHGGAPGAALAAGARTVLGAVATVSEGALVGLSLFQSPEAARAAATAAAGGAERRSGQPPLPETRRQLAEYVAGERRAFDLPLAPRGTDFERRVWEALLAIPYGETRSYLEIAAAIGRPAACRAVGRANGRNPIAVVIPCHRVIGADGSLTGYGGGLPLKRFLLDLESARRGGAPGTPAPQLMLWPGDSTLDGALGS
jgi:methylated-DNA-[protein]-cysteine S-methyltransferase